MIKEHLNKLDFAVAKLLSELVIIENAVCANHDVGVQADAVEVRISRMELLFFQTSMPDFAVLDERIASMLPNTCHIGVANAPLGQVCSDFEAKGASIHSDEDLETTDTATESAQSIQDVPFVHGKNAETDVTAHVFNDHVMDIFIGEAGVEASVQTELCHRGDETDAALSASLTAVDVAGRCSVCAAREAQRSLVRPGAKVSVLSRFLSGDMRAVVVDEGSTGVVVSIDADGDARIKLTTVERVIAVFICDFRNLHVDAGPDG
jgi:hypothetical protein